MYQTIPTASATVAAEVATPESKWLLLADRPPTIPAATTGISATASRKSFSISEGNQSQTPQLHQRSGLNTSAPEICAGSMQSEKRGAPMHGYSHGATSANAIAPAKAGARIEVGERAEATSHLMIERRGGHAGNSASHSIF